MEAGMDFPLPYGGGSEIEENLQRILRYLHSFPSVRSKTMVDQPEMAQVFGGWYGESTIELTYGWERDGIDAVREGEMIEAWLVELRAIISRARSSQRRTYSSGQ